MKFTKLVFITLLSLFINIANANIDTKTKDGYKNCVQYKKYHSKKFKNIYKNCYRYGNSYLNLRNKYKQNTPRSSYYKKRYNQHNFRHYEKIEKHLQNIENSLKNIEILLINLNINKIAK